MAISYPYQIDQSGVTASADDDEHIRDLIEQVLFTSPGERVNRPSFGSGLMSLVFAANDDAFAAAIQLTIQGSLQQWLGDLLKVEAVQVQPDNSKVQITVQYTVRRSQQRRVARFQREV